MIQCHTNFGQAACLLNWIYHPNDLFVLSIDANSGTDFGELAAYLERDNVILAPRHAITWGGISLIEATLSSIKAALGRDNWEYFFNLSAFDVPLISRADLCAELIEHAKAGVHNFVSNFGKINFQPRDWYGPIDQPRQTISAPSGAKIELRGNLLDLMKSSQGNHANFLPVTAPALRIAFYVQEDQDGKFLSCRPLYPFEAEERRAISDKIPYNFGRQWVTLHRQICEALFTSTAAITVFHNTKHVFIPDEIFFQTLFASPVKSAPKAGVLAHNKRYNFGAPERIADHNYEAVRATKSWFARKIAVEDCKQVVAWTTELMRP